MSLYFFLALLAVIFWVLGFLTHAFYFNRAAALMAELQRPHATDVASRQALEEAQKELSRVSGMVRTLERQLRERSEEMEAFKVLASRQDDQIRQLQRDAEAIRRAVSSASRAEKPPAKPEVAVSTVQGGTAETRLPRGQAPAPKPPAVTKPTAIKRPAAARTASAPAAAEAPPVSNPPPATQVAAKGTEVDDAGAASWKENLDNILNILEAMEKEVQK